MEFSNKNVDFTKFLQENGESKFPEFSDFAKLYEIACKIILRQIIFMIFDVMI